MFPASAQVLINEFLASNESKLADEDGDFSDWIELHNPTDAAINLNGWYLTDNANNLTKWRLPGTNIAANGYLVVFASNKNRATPGQPLHSNFALSADGEYLGLVLPDGQTVAFQYAPAFPPQFRDVSYGLWEGEERYFATPTPGAANVPNFYGKVADTKFNFDRGFYHAPFNLLISTATEGATIRYTTNGSPPTSTSGIIFSGSIPISRTTVIRAAAFKTGFAPSDVDTQTYIFVDDVIYQSTNGLAPPGWPATWGNHRVDYGMDLKVINDPRYSVTIKDDLKAIPTISLVMRLSDLFDPITGIYANSTQSGRAWERPASLELIHPDGTEGFQVNAGIRIRGNFSTSLNYVKHGFRGFFRSEYGDKSLKYPVFGEDGTDSFPGGIDLATFQNHSWSNWGNPGGTNALFLRDHFGRDTQLAMGHQGERGIYTHLYINGQYWGIYSPSERPEASFAATYYGGKEEDYDVIKATGNTQNYVIEATDGEMEGWARLWQYATNGFASDAAYQRVQGNNPDGSRNPAYDILVDIENLIDYQLIVAYTGSRDAPVTASGTAPNNWYGIRRRDGTMGFRFFVHDFEHSLLDVNESRIGPYSAGSPTGGGLPKSSPQYIWQQLQQNANFRLRVADHVHRHFFNGGVLTPEACIARFKVRTNQLHHALVGESARWGDADPNHNIAYTRDDYWLPLVARMLTNYFPQRSAIVLNQLRTRNLYPTVTAPAFNQHGGPIEGGFGLIISAPAGTIYYTLDGTDPRAPGNLVAPGAQIYSGAVALNESAHVKARVRSGTSWSALNEAAFYVAQDFSGLLISEIMYHPPELDGVDGDEFEFIELKNTGADDIDLGGVRFNRGIHFTFPFGTMLGAGEFILLASNPSQFAVKYPGVQVAGAYTGKLANGGERITLAGPDGATLISLSYSDRLPWPTTPDGGGFSLVPVNPNFNPDPNSAENWRASAAPGGSPGADDPSPAIPPVLINEILTHTDPPLTDAVELFNPTDAPVNVGGWFLTDRRTTPKKFRIPQDTIIPAGGFVVFTEQHFNPQPGIDPSFSFSSHGEEVYLYSADAEGNLTGYSYGFSFAAAANGVSFGRHVISTGETHFPPQIHRTLGAANSGPRIGPVIINEIRYRPPPGEAEFIELKNISETTVKLYDPAFPANRWKINGLGFTFPAGVELPAGALALVVEGDPAAFRAQHNVPAAVQIFGPVPGALQDNGERLQIQRPDSPDAGFVPLIVVDEVRYSHKAPWPQSAAVSGASLERVNAAAYGNDPGNWSARPYGASPGRENDYNATPVVSAGGNHALVVGTYPFWLQLFGTAIDDGFPAPLQIAWSQVSGPATVTFENGAEPGTRVRVPRSGTYVLRLTATDGALQSHADMQLQVTTDNALPPLITAGETWKYLDNGSNQGTAWRAPAFNDSTWPSAPAKFGFGNDGESTVLNRGPTGAIYITYYFRRAFYVPNAAAVSSLTARIIRDDGAVVYVNGVEAFRSNMPGGAINYLTFASTVVGGADENTFYSHVINPALLVTGTNVIAVEIHQANGNSTDLGFDLELIAVAPRHNEAPVVSAGPNLDLMWPAAAQLNGEVFDDGLPLAPGITALVWSKIAGPGVVTFENSGSEKTAARFSLPGEYVLRLIAHDGALASFADAQVSVAPETFSAWQARFFTPAELTDPSISGPAADADGDGHNNGEEFIAGTDPRDPESHLRFGAIRLDAGNRPMLSFEAVAGRTYSILSRTQPEGVWVKRMDVPAQVEDRTMELPDASAVTNQVFYRIVTP